MNFPKPPVKRYLPELEFGLESIAQAAEVVKQVRKGMVEAAFTKGDASPVTVADFAAQAIVACHLQKAFPQDPLVGEENAESLRQPEGRGVLEKIFEFLSPVIQPSSLECVCDWIDHGSQEPKSRFWTMDPIDGTKGFIRGDQYAVALALIENGKVQAAFMACPNLTEARKPEVGGPGTLVCAVRGEGAWWTSLTRPSIWQRLQASSRKKGNEAIVLRSFEAGHTDSSRTKQFTNLLGVTQPPLLMDSLAKYTVLASNEADLLLRFPTEKHPHEWIWDQASGVLIVEEAGGKVTDLDGKPFDFTRGRRLTANRGVLVTNGHLHDQVLKVLQRI